MGAKRLGERLREGVHTGMAERDRAAGVKDPTANPARRGKCERGKRLAHPAEMGPNGIGDPGHSAPSLRRTAL